jgi:stage V sporulation protein S
VDLNLTMEEEEPEIWNQIIPNKPPPTYRARTTRTTHVITTPTTLEIEDDHLMRVAPTTSPQAVAYAIRAVIFEQNQMPIIRAVGAGAVNQACKGIAVARGQVAVRGRDLAANIGFETVPGDQGQDISAMAFYLFLR